MDVLLRIISILGPLLLGTYLSTLDLSGNTKIAAWIICGVISAVAVWHWLRETAKEKKKEEKEEELDSYDRDLRERTVLLLERKPTAYIDGLGESPLLKDRFNEGQKYEKEYEFEEATKKYQECLKHPEATEENRVAANILVGNCYYALSELTEAERHYKQALDICKRVKDKREKLCGRSAALGNIGLVLRQQGDLDGALENHQKALEINEKIGRPEGMANNYGNIGNLLFQKGDLEGALENHKKALEINKEIGRPEGMANNYGNIGVVLADKGDLEGALENYRKSLEINKKMGRPEGMASNYGNIGNLLFQKGDLEGALENHKKALEINKEIGRPEGIANNYGNIGIVLTEKGDLTGALQNYERAVDIFERIGEPASAAHGYINIATIHSQRNDYKSAALLQLQALRIYSKIGMPRELGIAQGNLAISIRKLKKQGKYEEFLQEAKEKFGEEVAQQIKQITG